MGIIACEYSIRFLSTKWAINYRHLNGPLDKLSHELRCADGLSRSATVLYYETNQQFSEKRSTFKINVYGRYAAGDSMKAASRNSKS